MRGAPRPQHRCFGRKRPRFRARLAPPEATPKRRPGLEPSATPRSLATCCQSSLSERVRGGVTSTPKTGTPGSAVTGDTRLTSRQGTSRTPEFADRNPRARGDLKTPHTLWRAIPTRANPGGKGPIGIPPQRAGRSTFRGPLRRGHPFRLQDPLLRTGHLPKGVAAAGPRHHLRPPPLPFPVTVSVSGAPGQPTSRSCSIDESVARTTVAGGHVPDTPMGF